MILRGIAELTDGKTIATDNDRINGCDIATWREIATIQPNDLETKRMVDLAQRIVKHYDTINEK